MIAGPLLAFWMAMHPPAVRAGRAESLPAPASDSLLDAAADGLSFSSSAIAVVSLPKPEDRKFIFPGPDGGELLVLRGDGAVFWRGELVTTDHDLVWALYDVVQGAREHLCGEQP